MYSALYETLPELETRINSYDFITISPPSTYDHEINRDNITAKDVQDALKRIIEIAVCNVFLSSVPMLY